MVTRGSFRPAPGYDWGILAGWAWGASRVVDYLEQDASIDATRLIITGASRNGKAAMLDFFDWHLRGTPTGRSFDRFPTEQALDDALAAARRAAAPAKP